MKHHRRAGVGAATLVLSLLLALSVAVPGLASQPPEVDLVEYQVIEHETLGGNDAVGITINNRGHFAGLSRLPDNQVVHATVWRDGAPEDLETLGGPNSAVLFAGNNDRGVVVGVSETDDIDPRGEQWSCSAFFPSTTGHVCLGFVWEDGEMRELPTHGGTHGFAASVNNRGMVVGWAETAEPDSSCRDRDQVLGFVGAMWDTRNGDRIQELPPLPGTGDTASTGNAINARGQVVGISGECDQAVGRFSARHMAIWEDGAPTEIPHFGSGAWNTPLAINNHGVVVGFANAPDTKGGDFNGIPFIWREGSGTEDLDVLDGDSQGQALSINNRGQVVGLSRGPDGDTAVLWLDEQVINLNDVTPDYSGDLLYASDINNAGVITGQTINEAGEAVPFTAIPVDD